MALSIMIFTACGTTDSHDTHEEDVLTDSASMRVISPESVDAEEEVILDSVQLDLDSTQLVGTPEVIDDGKKSVEEPCNEVHRAEIASKRSTITELEEILGEVPDAESKAEIQSEIDELKADLADTIARHNCD